MANWDRMLENRARTGGFAGCNREDEDAYFNFFEEADTAHLPVGTAWLGQALGQLRTKWPRVAIMPRIAGKVEIG